MNIHDVTLRKFRIMDVNNGFDSKLDSCSNHQPAKFNRNPPRRAEDYGSYMTNIHTLCGFRVRSGQVLRHTSGYPGFYRRLQEQGLGR